ncbi:GNAT family N-acetyltransferase [Sporosarcina sp. BI001-red]|uniref:GNAT family N-acetyltransferase n=1 Tax=Sporosarcina sp. BI001-red TaxID=2282866 RepID=UPI000E26E35B|nr:GNAT family N-acetyltransferase [Sporosarcina sp. BI001-red]REB11582.1 GNAT family N-acetyltransferase [Sporosarcina sp. BI001-red]
MIFEMRKIETADIPFLRDMLYESAYVPEGQEPFPISILDEPSVSKFIDGWGERCGDIGLIAEIDDQSIGAIWLRLFEETPEIGIAICKEFRGNGVGNALMHALETEAKDNGYRNLFLSVDPRNPAVRLYERVGYVQVGWEDSFWRMEKRL